MSMRNASVAFALLLSGGLFTGTAKAEIPWVASIDAARSIAAQQQKLVLIHFYADDCPPCRRLEQNVFPQPVVQQALQQGYIPVKVNAARFPEVARAHNISSWPTDVFTDPRGRELYRTISSQDPNRYTQVLRSNFASYQAKLPFSQDIDGATTALAAAQKSAATNLAGQASDYTQVANQQLTQTQAYAQHTINQYSETANQYAQQAQQYGANAFNNASQTASNYAQQAQQYGADAANTTSQTANNYAQQVQQYGANAANTATQTANGYAQQVQQYGESASNTAANAANDYAQRIQQAGNSAQQYGQHVQQSAEATRTAMNGALGITPPPNTGSSNQLVPGYGGAQVGLEPAPTTGHVTENPYFQNPHVVTQNPVQPPVQNPGVTGAPYGTAVNTPGSTAMPSAPPAGTQMPAAPAPGSTAAAPHSGLYAGQTQPPPQHSPDYSPSTPTNIPAVPDYQPTASQPRPRGLDGYCPVTLMTQKKWAKGDPRFGAVHRSRTYLFANQASQRTFMADPDRYAPTLSGYDAVEFQTTGRLVEGSRTHGLTFMNQMFLFSSESSLEQFAKAPETYLGAVKQAMRTTTTR